VFAASLKHCHEGFRNVLPAFVFRLSLANDTRVINGKNRKATFLFREKCGGKFMSVSNFEIPLLAHDVADTWNDFLLWHWRKARQLLISGHRGNLCCNNPP